MTFCFYQDKSIKKVKYYTYYWAFYPKFYQRNEIDERTGEEEEQWEEQQKQPQRRPAGGETTSETNPLLLSLSKTRLTESAEGWRSVGASVCQTTWRHQLHTSLRTHTSTRTHLLNTSSNCYCSFY